MILPAANDDNVAAIGVSEIFWGMELLSVCLATTWRSLADCYVRPPQLLLQVKLLLA